MPSDLACSPMSVSPTRVPCCRTSPSTSSKSHLLLEKFYQFASEHFDEIVQIQVWVEGHFCLFAVALKHVREVQDRACEGGGSEKNRKKCLSACAHSQSTAKCQGVDPGDTNGRENEPEWQQSISDSMCTPAGSPLMRMSYRSSSRIMPLD